MGVVDLFYEYGFGEGAIEYAREYLKERRNARGSVTDNLDDLRDLYELIHTPDNELPHGVRRCIICGGAFRINKRGKTKSVCGPACRAVRDHEAKKKKRKTGERGRWSTKYDNKYDCWVEGDDAEWARIWRRNEAYGFDIESKPSKSRIPVGLRGEECKEALSSEVITYKTDTHS